MRAVLLQQHGPSSNLEVGDVAAPTAGPAEVAIDVVAAGVNFADTERRRGLYLTHLPLPDVLGSEGAGIVTALGPGVPSEWLGRRVAFFAPRAQAERAVAPLSRVIPLPDALDFVTGAAFPVQALTAWHVLFTVGRLAPGERVLVHSAAGGVGGLAMQLALRHGARVVGSVSSAAKVNRPGVLVRDGSFEARVLEDGPVDLVADAIGGPDALNQAQRLLAPFGRLVVYGTAAGAPPKLDLDALYANSLTVSAFWLRTPMSPAQWQRGVDDVLPALVDGSLSLEVTTVPLDEVRAVHDLLESGTSRGKYVLQVR